MKNKIKMNLSESLQKFKEPEVVLYDNLFMIGDGKIIGIMEFLMSKKYKSQIEAYRECKDKIQREKIKGDIECITPSGRFRYRKVDEYATHSGLICININSEDNEAFDLNKSKHIIGELCPSLYYAGLSVGGDGIFLIFRISDPKLHKQHFNALVYYLKMKFNLNVDRSLESPASFLIASYDENPYYNPNPTQFKHIMNIQDSPMPIVRTASKKQETLMFVKKAISEIRSYQIDITNCHQNWFKVGCALAHEFGEEARGWFHEVCKHNKNYNKIECDFEYDKCLRYKKDTIKIGTFLFFCKTEGIHFWK